MSQVILMLGLSVSGFPSAPTRQEMMQARDLQEAVKGIVARLNALIRTDLAALNQVLQAGKLKTIQAPEEVKE